MKYRTMGVIVGSLLLYFQPTIAQNNKNTDMKKEKEIIRGIDHVGITVPDIEAATKFFEEAFHAETLYDVQPKNQEPMNGSEVEKQLGLPKGSKIVHMRLLQIGESITMELFKIENADQDNAASLNDFGLQHLAIYVDDMSKATKLFTAAGGELLSEPHSLANMENQPGNSGVYGKAPWGTLIELITYPGGLKDKSITRWTPKVQENIKYSDATQIVKMTMFLKRNPEISHDEFVKHHIEIHGPLFQQIPEAQSHVIRYIQTHPLKEQTDVLETNSYDGTAELWFDSLDGLETVLTSNFYKDRVFPDEKTFLDHDNTLIIIGYQDVILGGDFEKIEAKPLDTKVESKLTAITTLKYSTENSEEKILEVLMELKTQVVTEKGCISFSLSQADNKFIIYEVFKSRKDLEIHKSQPYAKSFEEKLNNMNISSEVQILETIN
tara:strand:+ start:1091 stop:2404 length:1314 start_codon:yes stop_codon:yes gene_type:complete